MKIPLEPGEIVVGTHNIKLGDNEYIYVVTNKGSTFKAYLDGTTTVIWYRC